MQSFSRRSLMAGAVGGAMAPALAAEPALRELKLLSVKKIWDQAPHNAFTDLIRYRGQFYCVFREGKAHVSPDGALRVLSSKDGEAWESAALITSPTSDLRDAKITVTPRGELMLSGAGALHNPEPIRHQSMAWFSRDGKAWSEPTPIGDPNLWLWRVTWHKKSAYSVGYSTLKNDLFVRFYSSRDGRRFETVADRFNPREYPNEHALSFTGDGECFCLLRRDGGTSRGELGRAKPPYKEWSWSDLGTRIGGPAVLRIPDGRWVAAVRLYDKKVRTSLCWLDLENARLTEFQALPSGGDTSYAGLVWNRDRLWVSYYSSHEGKTSIYLAQLG